MSTLRRVTLGRLDGVLARATLGRLGGEVERGGGGSPSLRRQAWRTARQRPTLIATMRQAAIEARAAELAQPAKAPDTTQKEDLPNVAKVAQAQPVTALQLEGFKRSLQRQNAELDDLPITVDEIAQDFLSGDWLTLSMMRAERKRREDDAIAFLLISM